MTPRPLTHRGFSLVESMLAIVVLSFIGVLAMEAAGTSARAQKSIAQRQLADRLADALLAEIMMKAYPAKETAVTPTTRRSYNVIANYAGFEESPPTLRSGGALSLSGGTSGMGSDWRRKVELTFADPANPAATVASDSGLYRITVTVSQGNTLLSRRVGLRARD